MKNGRRVDYCKEMLNEMWARGDSYDEIAAALGCSVSHVHHLKIRHELPNRPKPTKDVFADDPTPEQIAERAAECRARRPEVIERHARVEIRQYVMNDSRGTIDARDFVW
jgi:uncharacterized protein YjcR